MNESMQVVDCCRYVVEPRDLWSGLGSSVVDYDPVEMRIGLSGSAASGGRDGLRAHEAYRSRFADAIAADFSAVSDLSEMERQGIDCALLLPTAGMYVCWSEALTAETASAAATIYNDFLSSYCSADAARLRGVALLSLQDPASAAAELQRCVSSLGFVAGIIRPNPVQGRHVYDPQLDELYAAAESLDVPILVNAPFGSALPEIGRDRYAGVLGRAAVTPVFEEWLAVLSYSGYQVFERFPRLKVGFVGAGCGWLPYWMDRLEEHWETGHGSDAPGLHSPQLQFRTHCFVVSDPWESVVPDVMQICGRTSVVWGSQYPSVEAETVALEAAAAILESPRLDEGEKRAVLGGTASALFHIDLNKPAVPA